ncbi:uncharacterized protein ASPGLDRAFT_876642 [Aspergillus glaucus CBS 516.65]|uniref:Uncharacterized protein n=1 Tax=Aspergillus glaucus CBS 516.65 TaxID=1160497 RepID=A0A1L9V889_ASPGL|nr:hypothetical protein ASPGLDRAFT_876642 [Aspergillus glaucus CBS 516.65]OJJ80144.1 hypothetical protein ASPGLDRAFT_876642 [Aspergillus glaucus CBS 516.65]
MRWQRFDRWFGAHLLTLDCRLDRIWIPLGLIFAFIGVLKNTFSRTVELFLADHPAIFPSKTIRCVQTVRIPSCLLGIYQKNSSPKKRRI